MNLDLLCLKCTLTTCHKGHFLCKINQAERQTKAYWKSRYHKSGRKFDETRRRINAKSTAGI